MSPAGTIQSHEVIITVGDVSLAGDLKIPDGAESIVVFAHGSGSSRRSPRNMLVAQKLNEQCHATLLFDLLTPEEEVQDSRNGELRFNINFLTKRLTGATDWVWAQPLTSRLRTGYFGASTGAAAALTAASMYGDKIRAVVSRGGRPDMARNLHDVKAPTLMIVGGRDYPVIDMNREAYEQMTARRELIIIPGATHLFEENGALDRVAELAGNWFNTYLDSICGMRKQ